MVRDCSPSLELQHKLRGKLTELSRPVLPTAGWGGFCVSLERNHRRKQVGVDVDKINHMELPHYVTARAGAHRG